MGLQADGGPRIGSNNIIDGSKKHRRCAGSAVALPRAGGLGSPSVQHRPPTSVAGTTHARATIAAWAGASEPAARGGSYRAIRADTSADAKHAIGATASWLKAGGLSSACTAQRTSSAAGVGCVWQLARTTATRASLPSACRVASQSARVRRTSIGCVPSPPAGSRSAARRAGTVPLQRLCWLSGGDEQIHEYDIR